MFNLRSVIGNLCGVILVSLFLLSCGKNSDPTRPFDHELVGTWNGISETHCWGSTANPDSEEVMVYEEILVTQTWTFKSNHQIIVESTFFGQEFLNFDGAWSTDGNRLTMDFNVLGTEAQQTWTYKILDNELILTRPADPNSGEVWDWTIVMFKKL
jgi:hypothetical protein